VAEQATDDRDAVVFVVFVRAARAESVALPGDGVTDVLVEFEQAVEDF
jgi:hypothetical protein